MLATTVRLHMNEAPYPPAQDVIEAARKGLRPGDLITAVNGHEVTTPGKALREMETADNDRALLLVRRGDSQYFAALALS